MEGADRSSGEQTGSRRKRCRRRPGELEQSDKPSGRGGICVFFCSGFFLSFSLSIQDAVPAAV